MRSQFRHSRRTFTSLPVIGALVYREQNGPAAQHQEIEHVDLESLGRCRDSRICPGKIDDGLIWRSNMFRQEQVRGYPFSIVRRCEADFFFGPALRARVDRFHPRIERFRIDGKKPRVGAKNLVGYRLFVRIVACRGENRSGQAIVERLGIEILRDTKAILAGTVEG